MSKTKKREYNYLTDEEAEMDDEMVELQIVIGLQTCKTKMDARELLQDIRTHQNQKWKDALEKTRRSLINELSKMVISEDKLSFLYDLMNEEFRELMKGGDDEINKKC